MRKKTEERRQHILQEAAAIFRDTGYERASMEKIADRVGGSKTTLYSYFASKEALFAAVMIDAMKAQATALVEMMDFDIDRPRHALLAFGRTYLDFVLSPEIIKVTRIGIAESDNDVGANIYQLGPQEGWTEFAKRLQVWIDRGLLRDVPAQVATLHLKGLLDAGMVEPQLFGVLPVWEREEAIERAVDIFLRAYAR